MKLFIISGIAQLKQHRQNCPVSTFNEMVSPGISSIRNANIDITNTESQASKL